MKPKRVERVERRRPVVEINLIAEKGKARPTRRGCLPLTAFTLCLATGIWTLTGLHPA